jgi:HD-like signal output (HDOD) protein
MNKKTILFVDDEPNILAGLKRMLRPMRKIMNFQFAEDAPTALEFMASEDIDVVVSDMRMPGMDGAALLTIVKEQYPHAIRIMLTGQADDEAVMRTIGVVHQFLTKPTDPNDFKQVIKRASALQDLMADERLKQLVSGVGSLPSLPETYAGLQKALQNPDSSLADVAKIIEQDLAMSAKVLQLVNSAFFGLYNHVDSPFRAVNLLGLDTIRALVLGVGVFSEMKSGPSKLFSAKALWTHSMTTAAFAKTIASHESNDREMIDHSFIAGLLHDVGKLLLFSRKPEEYEQAIILARETPCTLREAEQKIFGACHGDIGSYLIGLWGLPGPVVEAIAFHHRMDNYPELSLCPPVIVHAADYIYSRLNPGYCPGEEPQLNEPVLERIGMQKQINTWIDLCKAIQEQGEDDDR